MFFLNLLSVKRFGSPKAPKGR